MRTLEEERGCHPHLAGAEFRGVRCNQVGRRGPVPQPGARTSCTGFGTRLKDTAWGRSGRSR